MLNVVFASNDGYSNILLVSLTSLLENNVDDFNCINIYILDDGISENNKNKIVLLSEKYSCNINFIKIKNLNSKDLKLSSFENNFTGVSFTTYARLFISSILPDDLDKILYLDCDSLVLGSYKSLWNVDITDYYCAAVLDTLTGSDGLVEIGHDEDDLYVNAGFLLVNLDKWRKDNIEEKFIKFLADNQGKIFHHDQGVINGVLKNKIKILPPKYNLQFFFQYYDYESCKRLLGIKKEYYSKKIVDESRENPIFVHFCGGEYNRPWHNKYHRYHEEYRKYVKMANCDDVIQYIDINWRKKLVYLGYKYCLLKFLLRIYIFCFNRG